MKYLLFLLFIFSTSFAHARPWQGVSPSLPATDSVYHRRGGHIHGTNGLIIGVSAIAVGSALIAVSGNSDASLRKNWAFRTVGAQLATAGALVTVISGIVYIASKPSFSRTRHYTLYSQGNNIGIAYRF